MKPVYFLLNDAARKTPVCILRLGQLAEVLEPAGFQCIGDLLKPSPDLPDSLKWICGLDPEDAKLLSNRMQLLRSHVDRMGNVAWDAYHAECGEVGTATVLSEVTVPACTLDLSDAPTADHAPLVPSFEIGSGLDFIRAFPEVIDAIVQARDHAVDRAILVERLSRQPGERMTLDQIASSVPIQVTRERVRQRESKILRLIANALIHGRQRPLGVNLRPSFIAYWRTAAEHFGEESEITFTRFLSGLESAWNVPAEQLFIHLPLIMSVLTNRATVPEPFRAQMKRDRRLYQELSPTDSAMPVTRLALGKSVDRLLADGTETVGELFDAARHGLGHNPRSGAGRVVEKVLSALVNSRRVDGRIDWSEYESRMGLIRLPTTDPSSVDTFLATLIADLEAIIRANEYSLRAMDIFRLRITVAPSHRPTLAQTAVHLRSHGPSIKREESILLSRLNDLLVGRDLTRSIVSVSPNYLSYWSDAADVYSKCGGNFESFRNLAMGRWTVSREELGGSADILWAVLSQYPTGRRRKNRNANRPVPAPVPVTAASAGTVVLRGFRRVH